MKKRFLFGLVAILVAGVGFGGISWADAVVCHEEGKSDYKSDVFASIGNGTDETCYVTLQDALNSASSGATINLTKDNNVDNVIEIKKSVTIDGSGYKINTTATRGIRLDESNIAVTIKNLELHGDNKKTERGVQVNVDKTGVNLSIYNVKIDGIKYYAINVCNGASNLVLNIKDSIIEGWSALNLWAANGRVKVDNSKLIGTNIYSSPSNDFGTVVLEGDTTGKTDNHSEARIVEIVNTEIQAIKKGTNKQYAILFNKPSVNNKVIITGDKCEVVSDIFSKGVNNNNKIYFDENAKSIFSKMFQGDDLFSISESSETIESANLYPLLATYQVYYYWITDSKEQGGDYSFSEPFENGWLDDGEFLKLKKNFNLKKDLECLLKTGSFTLTFGDYNIDKGEYSVKLGTGITVYTDKQTDIFSCTDDDYIFVSSKNNDETNNGFIYKAVKAYNVTFKNGDETTIIKIASGEKAEKPEDPTKDGYVFKGWFATDSETAFDFDTAITSNIELTAKWNELLTVTFNGTDLDSASVESGTTVTKPADPTKDCNSFDGWFSDSGLTTAYDFATSITQDTTIYSKWTYTCSKSSGGGGGGGSSRSSTSTSTTSTTTTNSTDTTNSGSTNSDTNTNEENNASTDTENTVDTASDNEMPEVVNYNPELPADQQTLTDGLTPELHNAYDFARHYGITTKNDAIDADMYGPLNRAAMAKMLSQYAINILGQVPSNTVVPEYVDVDEALVEGYDDAIATAYRLGIMGINMPNNEFRPYDTVTRAEFGTALSRMLFGLDDGSELYYETHLAKLLSEGIITNADPDLQELRGYVMIMLMRSAKNS